MFQGQQVAITSMCVTDHHVWCADAASIIHIFSLYDCTPLLKFSATPRPNVRVKCMAYLASQRQVYVVLDNGHLVLCEVDLPLEISVNYSPVKTDCPGNGKSIHCLAFLNTDAGYVLNLQPLRKVS